MKVNALGVLVGKGKSRSSAAPRVTSKETRTETKTSTTAEARARGGVEVYIPTHSAMRLRHVWGTRSLGTGTGRTTKTEAETDVMEDAKAAPDDPEPLLG